MAINNAVQIPNVEAELKLLSEKNKQANNIRACLFNLVIYTQEERRYDYFKNIVSSIIKKFPCRIIFIQREMHTSKEFLHVEVSNETFTESGTTIACDQITISVAGIYSDRVTHIVSQHLVPDLPIYLFWGQDPIQESEILPNLQKVASRLIFDTECTKDLQQFSQVMLSKLESLDIEVMDIHWALISPWRDVISQIFHTESKITQLQNSTKINIHFNHIKSDFIHHSETQSLYLQAWLAHQLGWTVISMQATGNHKVITYRRADQGELTITLTPDRNENLQCGSILNIEIDGDEGLNFSLIRQDILRKVLIHVTIGDQCLLPYSLPLPNLKRGFNFIKEILYETTSEHYRNMLKQLAATDWSQIYK
ncbi:MAG: glucose-6-phosphate dehydrogenase assembly protein OpcA [Chlamydiota bacterium]|nr:glucose-6-phosphate dehydrogenase assembly protein OpcA [Chlamydiota bacterium]